MSCVDKIKDKASIGDASQARANQAEMDSCVKKCGDEMIKLLPTYTKRMTEWFKKGYYLQ